MILLALLLVALLVPLNDRPPEKRVKRWDYDLGFWV